MLECTKLDLWNVGREGLTYWNLQYMNAKGRIFWESMGQFSPDLQFLFCIYWTPTHHCRNELIDSANVLFRTQHWFVWWAPSWAEIILLVNFALEDHRCSWFFELRINDLEINRKTMKMNIGGCYECSKKKKCEIHPLHKHLEKKFTLAVSTFEQVYCNWEYWPEVFLRTNMLIHMFNFFHFSTHYRVNQFKGYQCKNIVLHQYMYKIDFHLSFRDYLPFFSLDFFVSFPNMK